MVAIEDLTGIDEDKRNRIINCLDNLVAHNDNKNLTSSIISGYNFFSQQANISRAVAFSNIHSSEDYKEAMLNDVSGLGFKKSALLQEFRDKGAAYLWSPYYNIRNEDGTLIKGLVIKDLKTGIFLDLDKFGSTVLENPNGISYSKYLLGFDTGWEININFDTEEKLYSLVNLFIKKSGFYLYDEQGNIKAETQIEKEERRPWVDAFKTPILIIGCEAVKYADKLKQFEKATRIFLEENNNEVSFIIHNHYPGLRNSPLYEELCHLGFIEEPCLANKHFLLGVDEF